MQRKVAVLLLLNALLSGCALFRRSTPRLPELVAVHEFVIPWEDAYPNDVAIDRAGRLWFTDRLRHALGVFDPATREFRSYATPTDHSAPYGIISAPDGNLWYAASGRGMLGRVDPETGRIDEYVVVESGGPQLLWWHDGEIWFSVRERRSYGRFDPSSGDVQLYHLEYDRPYSVVAARDTVWFSSFGTFRMIAVDPRSGEATVKNLVERVDSGRTGRFDRVRRFAGEIRRLSHDARSVWFTDLRGSRVGRYDIANDRLDLFPSLETGSQPYGIDVCCGGIAWYVERGTSRAVALEPSSGERRHIDVPVSDGYVRHLVIDEKRHRVWLPVSDAGRIVMVEYR